MTYTEFDNMVDEDMELLDKQKQLSDESRLRYDYNECSGGIVAETEIKEAAAHEQPNPVLAEAFDENVVISATDIQEPTPETEKAEDYCPAAIVGEAK